MALYRVHVYVWMQHLGEAQHLLPCFAVFFLTLPLWPLVCDLGVTLPDAARCLSRSQDCQQQVTNGITPSDGIPGI